MIPFIYHPTMAKNQHFLEAVDYLNYACEIWDLPKPLVHAFAKDDNTHHVGTGGRYFGEYVAGPTSSGKTGNIYVNVAAATRPAKTRGYVWSFPGHKTDRTASGILFHELGHHVAAMRHMEADEWRRIAYRTKPVTSYEPVPSEAWAESMRIYIGNPDLLRLARPERYNFIKSYFAPLNSLTWREVLVDAPDFIISSAQKFAEEKE